MSLFDKIKSGMTEASSKAKIVVEMNKLKLINISKQNEIKNLYMEIGSKVFHDRKLGLPYSLSNYENVLEQVNMLHTEIEQNKLKIINLGDVKQCDHCDKDNVVDALHCIHCGSSFIVSEQTRDSQHISQHAKQIIERNE